MNRTDWLKKQHEKLAAQVEELEQEREHNRSFDHKTLLTALKKQKLAIASELNSLSH